MSKSRKLTFSIILLVVIIGGSFALKIKFVRPIPPAGFPPGPPPGGNQMGGMPGYPMGDAPGNLDQSADFKKLHKYVFQTMKLGNKIERMEKSGKAKLTPQQLEKFQALMQIVNKGELPDEYTAKEAYKKLQALLTDKQRSIMSSLPPEHPFRRKMPQLGPQQFGPPPNMRP